MTDAIKHPQNLPWVSPYITVKDVTKAAEFYNRAFRFEIDELAKGEDGTDWHGELSYKKQLIMLGKEGAWGGKAKSPATSGIESAICMYLYCEDVDKFYEAALNEGAISVLPPDNMFWGDRMCKLKDIDDYNWAFATYISRDK